MGFIPDAIEEMDKEENVFQKREFLEMGWKTFSPDVDSFLERAPSPFLSFARQRGRPPGFSTL